MALVGVRLTAQLGAEFWVLVLHSIFYFAHGLMPVEWMDMGAF